MTTATRQPLTPTRIESIRTALAQRDASLADIAAATPAWLNTQGGMDRVRDVEYQNRWIATAAGRWGYEPAELIAAVNAA